MKHLSSMNITKALRLLLLGGLLVATTAGMAQNKVALGSNKANFPPTDPDKVAAKEPKIIEYLDTATINAILADAARLDSIESIEGRPPTYSILLIERAYDDRVALRWAPSDYVPWQVLNSAGYCVIRMGGTSGLNSDTLAIVKPWPIEKFKQHFAREDSLAGVAVQLIYGGAETRLGQTAATDFGKAIQEVYDEQQSVVGMAMMVAEMRPDLAEAMGLMYIDRTAQKDIDYSYVVAPNLPDSVMMIHADATFGTRLGTWKPQKFDKQITDSLQPPSIAMLYWERGDYFAYDIERQDKATGEWKKLNERPYVTLVAEGPNQREDNGLNMYRDELKEVGEYRYRLSGYDSFGDKSLPSDPYTVNMPDMVPPMPPRLKNIVVDHPDKEHAYATIYFHVDTIEADLKGYLPLYRHGRINNGQWKELTLDFTAPGDSVMRVDVSGLPTGQLSIAAYDQTGNQGASLPQMILLEDYMPPSAPANLRANVFPDGYLELRWTPSPEPDVAYYEVWFANDSTHVFMNLVNDELTDTLFVDSLALGLNQPYIYYKVRAVDYAGNSSADSKMLQVARPNFIPPSVCRIDSVWVTDDAINMWWIQSNEQDLDYHRLFRRMEGEKLWTLMGIYKADSLRQQGDRIRFKDSPKPNMRRRYVYAVETYNLTGVTSGLSLAQTFLFAGPRIIDIKLKLSGNYTGKNNETRLAWETGKVPDYGEWHYCVYRKGAGDEDFKFLMSTEPTEPLFNDFLIRPGETVEYYVIVQYDEGRRSRPSNIVKVSAPKSEK